MTAVSIDNPRAVIAEAEADLAKIRSAETELRLLLSLWAEKHPGDRGWLEGDTRDLLAHYFRRRREEAWKRRCDAWLMGKYL